MSKKLPMGRDFTRIWSASLITNLVDGVLRLASTLLAVTLTEDPVLIGMLGALTMLPWLLFAIPIGVHVDHSDRRRALVVGNFLRSGIALFVAFAISQDFLTIWILMTCVFIFGICEVLVDTTSQAILPQILDKSNFERGNSRLQISDVIVGQFAGTPLSGFLYAIAIALPFYFSTTGFLIAGILIALFPFQKEVNATKAGEEPKERLGLIGDIKFAVSYLYQDKRLFNIVVITTSIGFFYSLSSSTAALFILKELNVPATYFGIVLAIMGIGALGGSIAAPIISRRIGRGLTLAIHLSISTVVMFLAGVVPNIYFFVGFGLIGAFSISVWNILLMSLYQSLIPTALYGRIHGARRTIVWGLMPIGSVFGGFIAREGLRLPYLIGGSIAMLIAARSFKQIVSIGKESTTAQVNEQ
jgi:MFS family permease